MNYATVFEMCRKRIQFNYGGVNALSVAQFC
jgi:hypothetical protein